MSTTKSPNTICLPTHILDANISPRAREVLMLLASQTSAENPTLWICQAAIAKRLRCSVATVARTIQKLIETKLIVETGRLHEGRYKVYHVRWNVCENIKAISKKITKPIQKITPKMTPVLRVAAAPTPKPAPIRTILSEALRENDPLTYWSEVTRQRVEENRRKYEAHLVELRRSGFTPEMFEGRSL